MSPGTRAAAERALRKRDRQEALASGRMRPGLLYEESEDDELQPPLARRRRTAERAAEEGMEFEEVCVCVCVCVRAVRTCVNIVRWTCNRSVNISREVFL